MNCLNFEFQFINSYDSFVIQNNGKIIFNKFHIIKNFWFRFSLILQISRTNLYYDVTCLLNKNKLFQVKLFLFGD